MKPFSMAMPVIVLSLALGFPPGSRSAHAAERFTLEFPSRQLSGSLDEAAIVRVGAPFEEGAAELSKSAESSFLADLLRLQRGLPRSGAILVTIEFRAGDAEAGELTYRRLAWLRSAIIAKQSAISTDRVIIAAFARGDPPAEPEVLILPVELDLAGDSAEDDNLRAVALDSAFVGPVFVRLERADDAAVSSAAPTEPPPAPAGTIAAEEVQPPPAAPTAALEYRTVWCPAPSQPLDDFYPGGPIVPCGGNRP